MRVRSRLFFAGFLALSLAACGDDADDDDDDDDIIDASPDTGTPIDATADAPDDAAADAALDGAVADAADDAAADAAVDGPPPDADPTPPIPAIIGFTNEIVDNFADDVTGFRFIVGDADISVSALGLYDDGLDGFEEAHPVGIFDVATEDLVVGAQMPAGEVATLEGKFRFVDVSATTLLANGTYVALGYRAHDFDGIAWNAQSLLVAPFVTYDSDIAINDAGGLIFSNEPFGGNNAWFGPNFKAEVE
jgi:hypothetical protein